MLLDVDTLLDFTGLVNTGEFLRWREKKRLKEGREIIMLSRLHIVLNLLGAL